MISINRILCPVGHPSQADGAVRYAVALAGACRAELLLCHFVETPVDPSAEEEYKRLFTSQVRDFYQADETPPPRVDAVIIDEDPMTGIPDLARRQKADLIVMCSRRRPVAAALLGSMAEAICRTAPCPVLVVHPREHEFITGSAGRIELRRILAATDFSNDSALAVRYAASLAQEYQAELHVLHVLPYAVAPVVTRVPHGLEDEYQRAMRMLRDDVPEETSLWSHVVPVVRMGQPYREILSYAEDHQIDLICLGVNGAGFTMRALFGSNADRVLRQAPCPTLITRPLRPAVSLNGNPVGGPVIEGMSAPGILVSENKEGPR